MKPPKEPLGPKSSPLDSEHWYASVTAPTGISLNRLRYGTTSFSTTLRFSLLRIPPRAKLAKSLEELVKGVDP